MEFNWDEALESSCEWLNWAFERDAWEEVTEAFQPCLQLMEKLLIAEHEENKYEWSKVNQNAMNTALALVNGVDMHDLLAKHVNFANSKIKELRSRQRFSFWIYLTQRIGSKYAFAVAKRDNCEDAVLGLESTLLRFFLNRLPPEGISTDDKYAPNKDIIEAASKAYPIAYIIYTEKGGLALVVNGEIANTRLIWLPDLSEQFVNALVYGSLEGFAVAFNPEMNLADYESVGYINSYYFYSVATKESPSLARNAKNFWFHALSGYMAKLKKTLLPLAEFLETYKKAVLVPTGLLNILPIDAALSNSSNVSFGYTCSARLLRQSQDIVSEVKSDALLAVRGELSKYPVSTLDLDVACSTFSDCMVVEKAISEHEFFMNWNVSKSVLHFSGHAESNYFDPMQSRLCLSDKVSISIEDILSWRSKGILAILSGCETGMIDRNLPDEYVGMSNALLISGCAGVIATLWKVPDWSTDLLMTRFYDLWRVEGKDPCEALMLSKKWLQESTVEDFLAYLKAVIMDKLLSVEAVKAIYKEVANHTGVCCAEPFYWAGFIFTGAFHPTDHLEQPL